MCQHRGKYVLTMHARSHLLMTDARNPCETKRQLTLLVEKLRRHSQEMMLFFPASATTSGSWHDARCAALSSKNQ